MYIYIYVCFLTYIFSTLAASADAFGFSPGCCGLKHFPGAHGRAIGADPAIGFSGHIATRAAKGDQTSQAEGVVVVVMVMGMVMMMVMMMMMMMMMMGATVIYMVIKQ